MKLRIFIIIMTTITGSLLYGQRGISDSIKTIRLDEVVVAANRLPVLLKNNPGSVSIITSEILSGMTKTAGVEEALRLTPGVRIDNQHDGERIHVSIRGQGILTEMAIQLLLHKN